MTKVGPSQVYEDISVLFEHGEPPEPLLVSCYQAIEAHPTYSDFWYLASKILQVLKRPDDARKDINEALKFDPYRVEYNLQLFNVLIQQGQTEFIPRRINWLFDSAPDGTKFEIAKYADVAINSGLFSKLELIDSALVAILKSRNSGDRH